MGSLATLPATRLGSIVVGEALARGGVDGAEIDEVIMGNVCQAGVGQNPARQAALGAGLPETVAAMTVNKVCGSALKAVMIADQAIRAGDAKAVIAGGMESMSNVPFYMMGVRRGYKMGHQTLVDGLVHDGLTDAYENVHMGETAERVADRYEVSREQMDEWAVLSHQRALAAAEAGHFDDEIVSVEVPQRKGAPVVFARDESPRADTSMETLARLRPVFRKDGRVTAGNAPGTNDGAAAVLVTSAEYAEEKNLGVLARIVASTTAGLAPEWVLMTPEPAIRKILEMTGWSPEEVDYYEINEAFAVQQVALAKVLEIPRERHNVHGGGVALGHPIGASGARCLASLVHAMKRHGKQRGIVSLCLGGGNAVAMAVERD